MDDGLVCEEMLQLCQTPCRFAFSCHDITYNPFVKWEFPTLFAEIPAMWKNRSFEVNHFWSTPEAIHKTGTF